MRTRRRADVARVDAAVEHAHEPVQRRVGVASRAPPCAAPRSCRRTARRPCRSGAAARRAPARAAPRRSAATSPAIADQVLVGVEQAPRVAVGIADQALARGIGQRRRRQQRARARSSSIAQVGVVERLQHVHRGARQQRRVDLERRVLGGRADEGEQARLDVRQEGVLLRLVEAVHLVDEHDRARGPARCAACARSTASRMSLTPPSTAEIAMNCASKASAISRASVVLPTPGGPHRIIECSRPDSNATRSGLPGAEQVAAGRSPRRASRAQPLGERRVAARRRRQRQRRGSSACDRASRRDVATARSRRRPSAA